MSITRAIIIGISEYSRAEDCLPCARPSAELLRATLAERYTFDRIDLLRDKDATLDGITAALSGLESLDRTDAALIAFCGHAKKMGDRWYFVPQDSSMEDTHHRKFLPEYELFIEYMEKIRAGHILLIIDACYGGLLLQQRGISNESEDVDKAVIEELMSPDRPSRFAMTAGDASEPVSDGGGNSVSIFTEEMCDYLSAFKGAILPATALASEIKTRVLSRLQHCVVRQHPLSGHLGRERGGIFCFVKKGITVITKSRSDHCRLESGWRNNVATGKRRILVTSMLAFMVAMFGLWMAAHFIKWKESSLNLQDRKSSNVSSRSHTEDQVFQENEGKKLAPFSTGIYGVIVGPFRGQDEKYGKKLQDSIATILKGRAAEAGLKSVRVQVANEADYKLFDNENTFSDLLTNVNAKVAIWGDIAENRIIGYMASSDISIGFDDCDWKGIKPERVVRFMETTSIGDLRMKAITDLPTAVISMAAGRKAREEENMDEALRCFQNVATIFPGDVWTQIEIGQTFFCMHQPSNSLACYNKAIEIAPSNSMGYMSRAGFNLLQGNTNLAFIDFDAADRIDPGSTKLMRFMAYSKQGDYTNAIRVATELVDIFPYAAWFYYLQRAELYYKIGNKQQALEDIHRVPLITIPEREVSGFLWGRGSVYKIMDEYEKAIEDLSAAIAKEPKQVEIYFERAEVYKLLNNTDKAAADLKRVLQLSNNRPSILSRVATQFSGLHMWHDARDTYQRYIEVAPKWESTNVRSAREWLNIIAKREKLIKENEELRKQQGISVGSESNVSTKFHD